MQDCADRTPSPPFYLICAVQRAGTLLLCEYLAGTRRAGLPPGTLFDMSIGAVPFDMNAAIKAASTLGGMAGFRMFWNGWEAFLARLADADNSGVSKEILCAVPFVWLRRRDTLRQAVSFWRATTPCDQFRRPKDSALANAPEFDATAIRRFVELMETQDARWGRWFDENGIVPLEIAYEDLDRHPARTVNRVLDHLGVRAVVTLTQPTVKRQADRLTEQYVEQYKAIEGVSEHKSTAV
ncbi:MAG: Stf0 family sulfotransferase [Gammaproteobacteria bacterium]|nr:Stf0 family sulfotransferase [Gammaproteobacteria bacterium]